MLPDTAKMNYIYIYSCLHCTVLTRIIIILKLNRYIMKNFGLRSIMFPSSYILGCKICGERWNVGKSKCFCNVITYKQSSTHHFQGDQAAAGGILPTVNTL